MPVQNRYTVEPVLTDDDKEEALAIRFEVFVKEQGVSPDIESDEYDAISPHWLVRDENGAPIATARMTDKGMGLGKIERVAVVDTHRSQGIGKLLIEAIEQDAKTKGFTRLLIHAQTHCQGFYTKLGYDVSDPEEFDEDGIQHIRMEKPIL
jgi:predicted GNAT family N-acyltransferase